MKVEAAGSIPPEHPFVISRFEDFRFFICPDGAADSTGPSEGSDPGSSPGRDTVFMVSHPPAGVPSEDFTTGSCPASVRDARRSTEPQDGVRLPGGVLAEMPVDSATVFGVCRIARDFAMVEDQVRFLTKTFVSGRCSVDYGGVQHGQTSRRRTVFSKP